MSSFLLTSSQKQHRKVTTWLPTSSWQEAGSHLTAGWGVCPEKLGFPGLLVKPEYYFAWKITLGSNTGWTSSTKTLRASEMNRWAARACQLQVAHCERSTDVAAPHRHSSPTKSGLGQDTCSSQPSALPALLLLLCQLSVQAGSILTVGSNMMTLE